MVQEKEKTSKAKDIALSYYSRKDIQKAIFDFCKNREVVANFDNKFFAKRPDCLDYPSDILNSVKKGATSFHCSEELWENPLNIDINMTPSQLNQIKIGWDFLIDIDSKYLDYSKIAARLLIKTLEHHNVNNIGIKFSGSKGFHILIPFKAFPKFIGEEETKDHFPEWAREVASYLFNSIREPMNNEILRLSNMKELEERGEIKVENLCPKCNRQTLKKKIGVYDCQDVKCKSRVESMVSNRKQMLCPSCNGTMKRIIEREINFCGFCKINTAQIEARNSNVGGEKRTNKIKFKVENVIKSTEDSVDIVLVSSRHLFRAPYSLHEKTAFSSIPIDKEYIENFKPTDADPLKIKEIKSFMPNCKDGEARELLIQALDFVGKKEETIKKYEGSSIDLKGLTITEEMYPEVIKKILNGIEKDGRKRALSILLSFFVSLDFPKDFIEEKIREWNKKNYHPLKEGYIKSQIEWNLRNKRLPPNYDKPIYKEFGGIGPNEIGIKNPINYTIKMAMKAKNKKLNKNKEGSKI